MLVEPRPINSAAGDFDGDGFIAKVYGGPDCNDSAVSIYPGAPEVPARAAPRLGALGPYPEVDAAEATLAAGLDLPVPGARYRDMRSGLNGGLSPWGQIKRGFDGLAHRQRHGRHAGVGAEAKVGALRAERVGRRVDERVEVVVVQHSCDEFLARRERQRVRARWPGPRLVLLGRDAVA